MNTGLAVKSVFAILARCARLQTRGPVRIASTRAPRANGGFHPKQLETKTLTHPKTLPDQPNQGRHSDRACRPCRPCRPCQQRRQVQPLPVSPSRLMRRVCRPCRASQQLLRRITEISATNNRQRKAVNARTSRSNTTSVIGATHIRLAAHSLYSREQRSPGAPGAPSLPFKPSLPWAPLLPGTPFLPAGPG